MVGNNTGNLCSLDCDSLRQLTEKSRRSITESQTAMGHDANSEVRIPVPLGSSVQTSIEMTILDTWLPITESKGGNGYYATFHALNSGIGFPVLIIPVAFVVLGWMWGTIFLTSVYFGQLYTMWILVHLHECVDTGVRYNRYLHLFAFAFGKKWMYCAAMLPVMFLSAGTCTAQIIIGGSSARLFFQTVCGAEFAMKLATWEWYLAFTCLAVLLSQLPNLNSIRYVCVVGAITAVGFCTIIWVSSVVKGHLLDVSYNPVRHGSVTDQVFTVLGALRVIAYAFQGHNLILEIQSTIPSSKTHPSHVPMWKGVMVAYTLIAVCIYSLAIGGYWAYGPLIPANGGMLSALFAFHAHDMSKLVLGMTSFFVLVNALTSFTIYGMQMFDSFEYTITSRTKKALPWWVRAIFRVVLVFICFFIAVAFPFLPSIAEVLGGVGLLVTLPYPCFMWLKIKKPDRWSFMWWLNWSLGLLGMILSLLLVVAGIYDLRNGVHGRLFHLL